jgi:hypothetical protein
MRWIKNKLRDWLLNDDSSIKKASKLRAGNAIPTIEEDHENMSDVPTMRFKIFNARGGKIVEFSRYDRQKDRNLYDLYIIRNDEDFGERIAKIAMLESMKD